MPPGTWSAWPTSRPGPASAPRAPSMSVLAAMSTGDRSSLTPGMALMPL
jgi:hypothetical protein